MVHARRRCPTGVAGGASSSGHLLGVRGAGGVGAAAVEAVDDVAGDLFPLGVVVGVGGDLDGLGGVGQRQLVPVVYVDQALVEGGGGVLGVLQLLRGAPAGGRALLEQAHRVVVVGVAEVADVLQLRLLHGGGD